MVAPTAEMAEGGKAVVDIGGQHELKSLIESLPEHRWNRYKRVYTVRATPYTAERLAADFDLCSRLRSLASRWEHSCLKPTPEQIENLPRKTKPWEHQQGAIEWGLNRYCGIFEMFMGTGKSLVSVNLVAAWGAKRVVVLCPSAVKGVWLREFSKHAPMEHQVLVLEKGTSKKKAEHLREFMEDGRDIAKVVAINYESAWREALAKELLRHRWDLCLADEIHRIKSPQGSASTFAYKLGKAADRRFGLTGTLLPNSPLDLYAQFRFIEPAVFGTSYTNFRARYAITHPEYKNKILQWINKEELQQKIRPWIYSVGSDVLTLPPITHTQVPVELESKTMKFYREFEKELLATIDGDEIEAKNELSKAVKLRQVTGGTIKLEDGEIKRIGEEKKKALADLIESMPTSEKIVVFCVFDGDLAFVREVAEKLGRTYGEISGRRKDLTATSEMPGHVQVMGVNEQSGGTGIDLTAARYGIWFSLNWSLGDFDQSLCRLHRPGQEKPVSIYHLAARGTIDQSIYRAIDKKRDVSEEVLADLRAKA